MSAKLDRRAAALSVVVAAVVLGFVSRVATTAWGRPPELFVGLDTLDFIPGRSLGGGYILGVADRGAPALLINADQCPKPVVAVPILLTAVAVVEVADRAYGGPQGYLSRDVYAGRAYGEFGHVARLIARSFLETYNQENGYFVRFYTPANCHLADANYIAWADAVMTLGSAPAETGYHGATP